jgi:hypothetical protein
MPLRCCHPELQNAPKLWQNKIMTEQLCLFDKELIRTEPTREEIAAARFTRARLASWGVPWPPPKGWREELEARADAKAGRIPIVAAGGDGRFRERWQQFYRRGER